MYKPFKNLLIVAAFGLFIYAPLAQAQISAVPDPVQYIVSPETPGPGDTVTIEAQGVGGFLGNSTISWSQGGKVVLSGVGESTFSFTAGAIGTPTRVHVQIVSSTEGTLTHDFIILPSVINLVWEADTTVPPLYRGKSLYSAGSPLKVVAFPSVIINGAHVANSALSFQWSLNDEPATAQSGTGRSSISYVGSQLQQGEDVAVDVFYGSDKVGHSEVSIPATPPALLLYDQDPLRGTLYDTAMPASASLSVKEITVKAEPYFFANSSLKNGSLQYGWTLNGDDTTGPSSAQGILTLRQTGSGAGAATVGVSLQNNDTDKLVQAASTVLQLVFGSTASNSLFGL